MKYCVLLILFAGTPLFFLRSQNLVPNPGFESYKHLPCEEGLYFMEALLQDWIQPIPTTPDYWNSLAAPDCLLNPHIVDDSARTGKGMVGIVTASFEAGAKSEYKEYLEAKLSSKLKKGGFYNVEFYAKSRLKSPNPYPSAMFEANNLGAAFSDSLIHIQEGANSPDHIHVEPVIKTEDVVSSVWKKVGGCFNARSNAQYLLIGNFDSIDKTKLVQLTSDYTDYSYTYYFVDDVVVEELPYDVSVLQSSVPFCFDKTSIELNAFVEGATHYQWDDGSTASTLSVAERSKRDYFVTINFNECTYKHKFHVEYLPEIDLGVDTVLCTGETLKLEVGYPVKNYRWSDGTSDSIKYISEEATYSIEVPSDACRIEDAIEVGFTDCPGFLPNIITPNEDKYNQYLVFESASNHSCSLVIYNHWGEEVYHSADYQNDWNGGDLPNGVYYYKLTSRVPSYEAKGWVSVSR